MMNGSLSGGAGVAEAVIEDVDDSFVDVSSKLEDARKATACAMAEVETVVSEHFPEVLDAVKAELAVVATGSIKDSPPTSLVFLGQSGAGKSLALVMLFPSSADDALNERIYRSDEFTPASFLSQAGNRTKAELEGIDLLRRIQGKALVVKELAPMFRGKEDDLVPRFNKLTAILDGKGFTSDSGTQGQRGVVGDVTFQWLGGSTPLSAQALRVFGALGPRMVFYWVDRTEKDEAELIAVAMDGEDTEAAKLRACHEAVRALVLALPPVGSVTSDQVTVSNADGLRFVRWGQMLAALRSLPPEGDREKATATVHEHPERVIRILRRIAIGSALAHGRSYLAEYDHAQVAHIALSSGFLDRSRAVRAVLDLGGQATTPQLQQALDVTAPTAHERMSELHTCGIGTLVKGSPDLLQLASKYAILVEAPRFASV